MVSGRRWSKIVVVVLACLAPGGVASAGWSTPVNVPGTPVDVQAWDAGQITVSTKTGTTTGGFEFVDGGTPGRQITGFEMVSTFLDSNNCMTSIDTGGTLRTDNCGMNLAATGLGPSNVRRVRVIPTGYGYGCSTDLSKNVNTSYSPTGGKSDWVNSAVANSTDCGAISVLSFGGKSYALVGHSVTFGGSNVRLYRNGVFEKFAKAGNLAAVPLDTALVGDPSVGMRAFVVDASGQLFTAPVDAGVGSSIATPLANPPGVSGFKSIALYQSADERFGMAVVTLSAGGTALYSAVPDPDAGMFGQQWRPSTAPPAGSLALVSCNGAAVCGATTTDLNTANAFIYDNGAAPLFPQVTPPPLAPGASFNFPFPKDPDGDAVWLSADVPAGLTLAHDAGSITIAADPALQCDGGVSYLVPLIASDGRLLHDAGLDVNVTVLRIDAPLAAAVSPPTLTLAAGGPPKMAAATVPAAECQNFPVQWTPSAAGGITLTQTANGTSVTLTPPAHVCTAGPVSGVFEARTVSSVYGMSPPETLTVEVTGYGAPELPFANGTISLQPAGTSAAYSRTATHACDDGGVLPFVVETRWFTDGGLPGAMALTPTPDAGGVVTNTMMVQSTDLCGDETISLVAQNEVAATGEASAQAEWLVQLLPSASVVPPFADNSVHLQPGGTSAPYTRSATTLCANAGVTVQTRWFVDGGLPLATTLAPSPGTGGMPSDVITVSSTDDCADGTVALVAQNEGPVDTSGQVRMFVNFIPSSQLVVPFADDTLVTQSAGTTVSYARTATRLCTNVAAPVDTRWFVDGGLPDGTTLVPDPGDAGVITDKVDVVSTDKCASGTVALSAQNEAAGEKSAAVDMFITLAPSLDPVEQAKLIIQADDGGLQGDAIVSGINCVEQRALQGEFFLQTGGEIVASADAGVPGRWSLTPPVTCEEKVFVAYGQLAGVPSSRSNDVIWTSEAGDPALGAVDAGVFVARCEEGRVIAEGALQHEPDAASCLEQTVTWSQASGPLLTTSALVGSEVGGRAEGTRWDDLVGLDLGFTAVASAGTKQTPPASLSTHIVPSGRFVTARVDTDAPIAQEGGVVAIIGTLENTSSCAVENATWVVTLQGLSAFGEVANVAGVRKAATVNGDEVTVGGIALPPGERVQIVVASRVGLLSRPSAQGQVFLGGEAISERAGLGDGVAETGCGCAGGGSSGLAGLALLLMVRLMGGRLRARS